MACSCYDELAALYVKFETIYDLCQDILDLIAAEETGNVWYGRPRRLKRRYKIPELVIDELWDIITMAVQAGLLD